MNFKKYIREGKGAADITQLLADGEAFNELVKEISALVLSNGFAKVVCIEGRGFILGSAVAFNLGKGVIPLRYPGKLKNEVYSDAYTDYSGNKKTLEIHKDAIKQGEKVVIVDDWIETGATLKSAIKLVELCGGTILQIAAFVDDSNQELKDFLSKYNYKYLVSD